MHRPIILTRHSNLQTQIFLDNRRRKPILPLGQEISCSRRQINKKCRVRHDRPEHKHQQAILTLRYVHRCHHRLMVALSQIAWQGSTSCCAQIRSPSDSVRRSPRVVRQNYKIKYKCHPAFPLSISIPIIFVAMPWTCLTRYLINKTETVSSPDCMPLAAFRHLLRPVECFVLPISSETAKSNRKTGGEPETIA